MKLLLAILLALMLAACGSAPKKAEVTSGKYYLDDGPPDAVPGGLENVPDAVPRDEPFHKFANRPYTVFARLAAGAITLTFFTYAFVNMGMVSGILPVVGVPLPMISYGGTALLSMLAGFGILMSISTHKQLVSS